MTANEKKSFHRFIDGHRGYLFKQGHVFKNWREKFFVLDKKILKCYADESLSKLNGEYIIDADTQIYDVPGETDGRGFLFYLGGKDISALDEVLFLSASSKEEKNDWIEAFTDAAHDGFKLINQPEIWRTPFYPMVELQVSFNGALVDNGNVLRPSAVEFPPNIILSRGNLDAKYSIVMVDYDAVLPNAEQDMFIHWAVINFSGNDIESGHQAVPYMSPAPPYNSGLHRFFFLIFHHYVPVSTPQLNNSIQLFQERDGANFNQWIKLMNLTHPSGINGFYAGWEKYCDDLHNKMNYTPPEPFRSPAQDYHIKRNLSTQKVEQARLDLFVDLAIKDIFPPGFKLEEVGKVKNKAIALNITFNHSDTASDGCALPPGLTQKPPIVTFPIAEDWDEESDKNCFYCLIMTDPDAPSRVNHDMREFVHWVVVNIPSNSGDVSSGSPVLPYLGPCPPHASGLHRYIFSFYKQKKIFENHRLADSINYFKERKCIHTYEWITELGEEYFHLEPVGLEAFLSEWDDHCDKIHFKMGWLPPHPYRSPAQISENSADPEFSKEEISKIAQEKEKRLEEERSAKLIEAEELFKNHLSIISSLAVEETKVDEDDIGWQPKTIENKAGSPIKFLEAAELTEMTEVDSTPEINPVPVLTPPTESPAVAAPMESPQISTESPISPTSPNNDEMAARLAEQQRLLKLQQEQFELQQEQQKQLMKQQEEFLKQQEKIQMKTQKRLEQVGKTLKKIESKTSPRSPRSDSPKSPESAAAVRARAEPGPLQRKYSRQTMPSTNLNSPGQEEEEVPLKKSLDSKSFDRKVSFRNAPSSRTLSPGVSMNIPEEEGVAPKTMTRTSSGEKKKLVQRSPSVSSMSTNNLHSLTKMETKSLTTKPSFRLTDEDKAITNNVIATGNDVLAELDLEIMKGIDGSTPTKTRSPDEGLKGSRQSMNLKSTMGSPKKLGRKLSQPIMTSEANLAVNSNHSPLGKQQALRARIVKAKSAFEFCEIFGTSTTSVFEGEIMKKKFSKDFRAKDSLLWVDPVTKSLHWAKSKSDKANSKYILLERDLKNDKGGSTLAVTSSASGEMKGTISNIECVGGTLTISTTSGDSLELKLSADGFPPAEKRAVDWVKVIQTFFKS